MQDLFTRRKIFFKKKHNDWILFLDAKANVVTKPEKWSCTSWNILGSAGRNVWTLVLKRLKKQKMTLQTLCIQSVSLTAAPVHYFNMWRNSNTDKRVLSSAGFSERSIVSTDWQQNMEDVDERSEKNTADVIKGELDRCLEMETACRHTCISYVTCQV